METLPTKVPLFEAAQRAEALVELVSEGVDVEAELGHELIQQMQNDLALAIDRRYFLKNTMEKQIETLKQTRDFLSDAIKKRESILESVKRTTTLALESFRNIMAEGIFCKVSLRKNPVAVRHDLEVKSKTFSNMVDHDALVKANPEVLPYLKMVTIWTLDVDFLKEALATESYSWARLEQKNTCQFRSK